ncbi:MAG: hypothetical protein AAGF77_08615 [Bacteroidota bacterium]
MKTKILFISALLCALWSNGQKVDAQELADYQNNLMIEKLDLSEVQVEQVKVHNAKYAEKQAELMNREGSMFGKIGDVKRMKKARNAALEKILSPTQMEVFEDEVAPALSKHMRKKMMG